MMTHNAKSKRINNWFCIANLTFLRVYWSFIVNLKEVTQVAIYEKYRQYAWIKSGAQIPVSKQGGQRLKELLTTSKKLKSNYPCI
jgi:septin family protein